MRGTTVHYLAIAPPAPLPRRLGSGQKTDFFADEVRSVLFVGDIVKILSWLIKGGIKDGCVGVHNMGGPCARADS